mmetsp:Transcript_24748/g.69598  ORF Transcript_24748/g.69598 Transcript_24748/m.69598 type:complete len:234 (-) Transcript_24748:795-1496(-)
MRICVRRCGGRHFWIVTSSMRTYDWIRARYSLQGNLAQPESRPSPQCLSNNEKRPSLLSSNAGSRSVKAANKGCRSASCAPKRGSSPETQAKARSLTSPLLVSSRSSSRLASFLRTLASTSDSFFVSVFCSDCLSEKASSMSSKMDGARSSNAALDAAWATTRSASVEQWSSRKSWGEGAPSTQHCLVSTSNVFLPAKSGMDVSISTKIQPHAHTSPALPPRRGDPSSCSGGW